MLCQFSWTFSYDFLGGFRCQSRGRVAKYGTFEPFDSPDHHGLSQDFLYGPTASGYTGNNGFRLGAA